MHVLTVDNVNEALPVGLAYLRDVGVEENTRNGPALVAPTPVTTVYLNPRRRVLFDPKRNANPFFHLIEALWILDGAQDVKTLAVFNKRMSEYSDNGFTFHAPYGYRLREHFGFDQLDSVVNTLRKNLGSRQAVASIWDPEFDASTETKDLPCNDMIMFRVRQDSTMVGHEYALDITVCNRSNDVIWGAYGANAVQFSFIQEYIAARLEVGVGRYYQVSNNYHVYTENPYFKTWYAENKHGGVYVPENPYSSYGGPVVAATTPVLLPYETEPALRDDISRLMNAVSATGEDLNALHDSVSGQFNTELVRNVAAPMVRLWCTRSERMADAILDRDSVRGVSDWLVAAAQWVKRSNAAKNGQHAN